jgi:TetR/AcrR family acrAB operon transcriptional repressor
MRRTAAEAQRTRQLLLDTASRVFARDGFDASTLVDVAREAGLTRGAIYWHFKDKQDLFQQVADHHRAHLESLKAVALGREGTPWEKLRRLLAAVIDNFYDNEAFRQEIVLTWYRLSTSQFAPVMASKSNFVQNFLVLMESLLTESRAQGAIRAETDCHLAAFHLSCLINGLYRLHHVAPDWAHDKDAARRLFDDYLGSLTEASDHR